MGGSRLAAPCAARLPALDPETAFEALQTLATDGDRPVEARLAAIRQLPPLANEAVITALTALTDDPVQQVRAAALAAFAELAREPDDLEGLRDRVADARFPKRAKATLMSLIEEHFE
ncbi:MAG: HEAT repeat domain-containing protein [Hyphomicrobiales bacterium]|nr:HEAT repeat domain-containing protein [Hyphomicrobiales bacterium]